MGFIKLKRKADGETIYVNVNLIAAVYPHYERRNITIVSLISEEWFDVEETIEEVMKLIRGGE